MMFCQKISTFESFSFEYAFQSLSDQGVTKDLAEAYQADPLQSEFGFRDLLNGMGRTLSRGAFESFVYRGA